jgi:hypothetical protein
MQPKPACVSLVWMPNDEAQAVSYANALDRSRFQQFLVDYGNGLLGHLDTVDLICYAEIHSVRVGLAKSFWHQRSR